MMAEYINFKNKEEWLKLRSTRINSTDIAAVLGICPYKSKFELWHEKAGNLKNSFVETERVRWGSRLEDAIANGVIDEYRIENNISHDDIYRIEPFKSYAIHHSLSFCGSSFDYQCNDPTRPEIGTGILECKLVDYLVFKSKFMIDGEIELPLHISCQIQWQLWITGFKWGLCAVLTGGNKSYLINVERNEDFIKLIEKEAIDFWKSIKNGQEPDPDFSRDISIIKGLFSSNNEAKLSEESLRKLPLILQRLEEAKAQEAAAKEDVEQAKAEAIHLFESVEEGLVEGFKFSFKEQFKKSYTVKESKMRVLRVKKLS